MILLGHTADDRAEAAAMRQAGSTTPDPAVWSPSPVWPAGRDLYLLRPMLNITRSALRQFLAARGEAWIEDPANDNLLFARSRARLDLKPSPTDLPDDPSIAELTTLARSVTFENGFLMDRDILRQSTRRVARALVGRACLCAGGGSRSAKGPRLDRLTDALLGSEDFIATLVGCRVDADRDKVLWARNPGEIRRGGHGVTAIKAGVASVWDGRFEVISSRPLIVSPLAGHGPRLSSAAQLALKALPSTARASLPVVMGDRVVAPSLERAPGVEVSDVTWKRFQAACGEFQTEPG